MTRTLEENELRVQKIFEDDIQTEINKLNK